MKIAAILIPLSFCLLSCEEIKPEEAKEIIVEVSADSIPEFESDAVVEEEVVEELEETSMEYQLYSDWYEYLVENFDTISPALKVIGSSAYGGEDICHFKQQFEKGIVFEYGGCGEGGANETIVYPNFPKEAFYELINTHFFSEDNTWNEDSTSYEADGAGCYYSIEIKNDTSTISTYCGC